MFLFFLTKEAPSNRTVVPTSRSSDVSAGTSAAAALAVAALLQTTMSNRALALVESSWENILCDRIWNLEKAITEQSSLILDLSRRSFQVDAEVQVDIGAEPTRHSSRVIPY